MLFVFLLHEQKKNETKRKFAGSRYGAKKWRFFLNEKNSLTLKQLFVLNGKYSIFLHAPPLRPGEASVEAVTSLRSLESTLNERSNENITPHRAKRCCKNDQGPASLFYREAEVLFGALKTKSCLSEASSFCLAQKSAGVVQKVQTAVFLFCYLFSFCCQKEKSKKRSERKKDITFAQTIKENMYQEAIEKYLKQHGYEKINLKAVLFDMDGVLFNSMPNHASSWHKVMERMGFGLSEEEAYMHEGRTGADTINIISRRERGCDATDEEIKAIYAAKSEEFNRCPPAERMPGALEVLNKIKADGLTRMIVTGSGQVSLLEKLNKNFPDIFQKELMVTAFDIKFGKPNPDPYLMALEKGGLKPNEAIVIENAPLGVQAGVAAGIFTIAVNTGPLPDEVLLNAGANLLFHSMPEFNEAWDTLKKFF